MSYTYQGHRLSNLQVSSHAKSNILSQKSRHDDEFLAPNTIVDETNVLQSVQVLDRIGDLCAERVRRQVSRRASEEAVANHQEKYLQKLALYRSFYAGPMGSDSNHRDKSSTITLNSASLLDAPNTGTKKLNNHSSTQRHFSRLLKLKLKSSSLKENDFGFPLAETPTSRDNVMHTEIVTPTFSEEIQPNKRRRTTYEKCCFVAFVLAIFTLVACIIAAGYLLLVSDWMAE